MSVSTLEKELQRMVQTFRPEKAGDFQATYHLEITGSDGGVWTIMIAQGRCTLQSGASLPADTHIILDYPTYQAFIAGRLNLPRAYMLGRLKVRGNLDYALKLKSLFSSPSQADASTAHQADSGHQQDSQGDNHSMQKYEEANQIIRRSVILSAGAGLIPLPFLDLTAALAIQMDMLGKLAKLYEADYSDAANESFITALVGSSAAKIASSMVKLLPGFGTVFGGVSMSVMSGASTYAIGQVAIQQFEKGSNLFDVDLKKAQQAYQTAFDEGKAFVSDLDSREIKQGQDASKEVFAKLEQLANLKEKGVISEAEFQAQKEKLLARL